MKTPEYVAVATLEQALILKNEYGEEARVIAGGTDLILRMNAGVCSPSLLIDLKNISLDSISNDAGSVCIGSYVTQSQLLASVEINSLFPALSGACRQMSGPPIRSRATVGGNIVNASPAADLVPSLLAYDADIMLASCSANRVVPLVEFFTGPGQTVMAANEILVEVRLPLLPSSTAAAFIKLGQRQSMAISVVNLAARFSVDARGVVNEARIALGSLAPTPLRAFSAEDKLTGKKLSDALIDAAANEARQAVSPISDLRATKGYRQKVTESLVRRALKTVWNDLSGGEVND
jgi:carbon-monoxide dehydrogenase medium subunit